MDVDYLKEFISKYKKDIIDFISMRQEIENWKKEHNGKPPEILIDLKGCHHMLVLKDQTGVILGGHYDRYNKMMRQFLENIHGTGAKLVFFMVGKQRSDDLPFFIPKTEGTYIESLEILDVLEEKSDLKGFLMEKNRFYTNLRMELSFNYNLRKLVSNSGDIHVTYEQHNQEIAQYVKQNADNILAIITDDIDFLVFSGSYEFWRAKSINFREMTCNRYDKQRMYDKLGFEYGAAQMQLLSALCRSIFLPLCATEGFLFGLANANESSQPHRTIWNVSAYVKRQPFTMADNHITYQLEPISRDVFGEDYSLEQLNAIANGLLSFYSNLEQPNNQNSDKFLDCCKKRNSFAYKLATDKVFNVGDITYMDFRINNSKSYAELVIPILMKMCGILFKDYVRRPSIRLICMKHAHDEPSKVTEEAIIYPSMKLPKVFDLMFETRERRHDKFRWTVLEWVLYLDDGTVKEVRNTKKRFVAVIITLLHLVQQEKLTAKEANIILYTEQQIQTMRPHKTGYPESPNAHYIRIAHLYVKMYVLISHCFEICGLNHMTDLLRFDGASFHENMVKFGKETKQLVDSLESSIKSLWIFS